MPNDPNRDISDSFDIDAFVEDNLCDTYAEMREAQESGDFEDFDDDLEDTEWDDDDFELDDDL